jgi:uncharacterized membrane protein
MRRSWGSWLLAASLALNLILLGAFGGLLYRTGGAFIRGPETSGLDGYARALPSEHRRALMREIRREDWQERREAMTGASAALRDALRAEPFQPDAVRGALADGRAAQSALADRAAALLLARIERMSPEERAEFADRIGRRSDEGRPGRPRP